MELYRRYVDDITSALKALDPGVRFNKEGKKMEIVAELIELYREEHEDKRTFEELKKIANTVFDCV